ncbi:MAG: HNH endonuclease [Ignavibacteriales bacterium]|nr:HNH endonuclease [Ignavibacteriales bacterium]
MEDDYSWKELAEKFDELGSSLKGLRLDYQWGSVPSIYSLAGGSNLMALNQFKTLAYVAGNKLVENYKSLKEFAEVFTIKEPINIWYNFLRLYSGQFNIGLVGDQTVNGVSIGAVYHGSLYDVVSMSSQMCMRMIVIKPKPVKKNSGSKTTNSRNDKKIPKRIEKKIFQEANSTCPFCGEREISFLDIHHIIPRSQSGPNEELNLILACKKCHTDIEEGIISIVEVMKKKQDLIHQKAAHLKAPHAGTIFNLNKNKIDSSIIANTVNIKGKRIPKMHHPIGSIGANLNMNNYVKYLIDRYYNYRKVDSSYGRFDKFNHSEIHTSIQSRFKAKTYFIPEEKFNELCVYLYDRIDKTIQGKRNKSNGVKNYETFEEYLKL